MLRPAGVTADARPAEDTDLAKVLHLLRCPETGASLVDGGCGVSGRIEPAPALCSRLESR